MKKYLVLFLLLPLCFAACTPAADTVLFAPTPGVTDGSAAKNEMELDASGKETDADEVPEGTVLRVLAAAQDSQPENVELFEEVQGYRARRNMPEINLVLSEIATAANVDDRANLPHITSAYYNAIALKLLAGDDDFDMFFISSGTYQSASGQINAMLRKEYIASMESLGLAGLYDDMLPGVKELCMADGEILLAPLGFVLRSWALRQEPFNKLAFSRSDIPGTVQALTDLVLIKRDAMADGGIALTYGTDAEYFMSWFTDQYVAEYMTRGENTQAMWDAYVDMLDRLFASGLTVFDNGASLGNGRTVPYDFPVINYTEMLLFDRVGVNGGGMSAAEVWDVVLLPSLRLTEDAKEPISSGAFLAVNPNSPNLDMVKAYLTTFLGKEFRLSASMRPVASSSACKIIYDDKALYDNANFLWYKKSLPYTTRGYTDAWWSMQPQDHLMKYADYIAYHDGEITSAQWKAKVDRELEFLRDE